MDTNRRHDIDWLRVIAIGLLLIYHIAIIFQPWAMFIGFIRSDEMLEILWKPMTLINVWRIPFLFYVSGMGVYFAMRKRTVGQLLADRALRILVPYLFGIVAIVPLHFLIFQNYYHQPLSYFAHPAHLWFLGNIVIYISLLFAIFNYLMKHPENKFRAFLQKVMSKVWGPMLVIPFFIAEVLLIKPDIFSLYAQTMHGYGIGFLAFFFGFILVYTGAPLWNTLLKWRWVYALLAFAFAGFRLMYFQGSSPNYLMAIESNVWIFALFGFGYKYLNRPSKLLSYLSAGAYPIYIIHMFVLYGAASFILPLSMPVMLKFILTVLVTLITCIVLFEAIKRIRILRPLFGMSFTVKPKL